ncbi:MAG TPA: LuxR C-terminal-related transcriptional regulator, partial [Chryseolinea sp.]
MMKKDALTAARTFVSLFSREQTDKEQLSEFKAEVDNDIIHSQLRFAEMIYPERGIMICPISHAKFKYVGLNCERIFGHSRDTLMRLGLADFFDLIHPDDLPPVQQCLNFIKGMEPYDPATHRFSMRYRIRNQDGAYTCIEDEKIAIKTSNESYLYMLLFSNISNEEKFYHVSLDIFKQVKGKYLKYYTYNPKQHEKVITPRQNDIAKLILKGFSNQEIADCLSLSVFTVKNHKKLLFKKVNAKNSVDFANYV